MMHHLILAINHITRQPNEMRLRIGRQKARSSVSKSADHHQCLLAIDIFATVSLLFLGPQHSFGDPDIASCDHQAPHRTHVRTGLLSTRVCFVEHFVKCDYLKASIVANCCNANYFTN